MSKVYSSDEVFKLLGEDNLKKTDGMTKSGSIEIDGYNVYIDSWRYRTFYQKGTKCTCCGKEGMYFKLTPAIDNQKRAHFNLYAEDGTLMTKDHIIPKSRGGKNCINNFQTYCEHCNRSKGNTIKNSIRI